jgi:hypothetical protein
MRIVIAALLLAPAAALAGSAFDGTWKGRMDSVKQTGNPDVFAIADGTYSCTSCKPPYKIKADGTDQKVAGHDYYDTMSVKVVDAKTLEETRKLGGKVTGTVTESVSADGQTLTFKFIDYTGEKPATGTVTEKRVAPGPAGSHAASGSWAQDKMTAGNDALVTVSYEMGADHFSMKANGQSYNAKFDGKEYPVAGDPGHTTVVLKRIDANTVTETDRRGGKITDEIRIAAAKDGKTVELTDKDVQRGQTTTLTLDKQ